MKRICIWLNIQICFNGVISSVPFSSRSCRQERLRFVWNHSAHRLGDDRRFSKLPRKDADTLSPTANGSVKTLSQRYWIPKLGYTLCVIFCSELMKLHPPSPGVKKTLHTLSPFPLIQELPSKICARQKFLCCVAVTNSFKSHSVPLIRNFSLYKALYLCSLVYRPVYLNKAKLSPTLFSHIISYSTEWLKVPK